MESGAWLPPMDIYEIRAEYYVYADLAGVDAGSPFRWWWTATRFGFTAKGHLPPHKDIACVHQLEIELGGFDRTVNLPGAVDVERPSPPPTPMAFCA